MPMLSRLEVPDSNQERKKGQGEFTFTVCFDRLSTMDVRPPLIAKECRPMHASPVVMEFHVSREARDRYQFGETLFSLTGNVLFANFHAARVFAQKMNEQARPGPLSRTGRASRPDQRHGADRRDPAFRRSACTASRTTPQVMRPGARLAGARHAAARRSMTDPAPLRATSFPPAAVYKGEVDAAAYLEGDTAVRPQSPARPGRDAAAVAGERQPGLLAVPRAVRRHGPGRGRPPTARSWPACRSSSTTQPAFGPDSQNLVEMLRSPAMAVPHSLPGQLAYILEKWGYLLGKHLYRLLVGLDLIKEEEKAGLAGRAGSRPGLRVRRPGG